VARVLSAAEVRSNLSRILSEAYYKGEPTIVERNRQPVAAIIGIDEYRAFRAARDREARFQQLLSIADRNPNATPEQVEADVAEAVTAVRASW
jgi:prevent-host-death family protein